MRLPKDFDEYVQKGVMRKCSIDKPRAEFLLQEAQKSFKGLTKRLSVMGIDEETANSIVKDCYDILMELLRAHLLLNGFISSGLFAHEAEVAYMKRLGFKDTQVSFLNDLRYFRNSVTYYGKILTVEFAEKVTKFTIEIYPKLVEKIDLK
ncbi:MAG TPA: hypothetical protein VJH97_01460 [Candidatus Nanoarchaeia archaeon]|nr:hypothetical protein [Candidatus Nanoarchaeia archaeon]